MKNLRNSKLSREQLKMFQEAGSSSVENVLTSAALLTDFQNARD